MNAGFEVSTLWENFNPQGAREGRYNRELENGFAFIMTYYRMESGRWELVAYVS